MNVTGDELSIVVNNLPDVDYSFGVDENCSIDQDISTQNVENHGSAEDQMEEGELNDSQNSESNTVDADQELREPNEKKQVRQYLNKAGEFVVGIDLFSEEAKAKAEERIRRFGQVVRPDDIVTDDVLSRLYASLGVEGPGGDVQIRYTTVHLLGTDDLSTGDVFDYFREFPPTSVEWINDQSCNVVWPEESSAARALLKLSRETTEKTGEGENEGNGQGGEVIADGNDHTVANDHEKMEVEPENANGADDDDEDEEEEEEEEEDTGRYRGTRKAPKSGKIDRNATVANDNTPDVKQLMEDDRAEKESREPPGKWRVGNPHPKTGCRLMMRYATIDDKKQVGANAVSRYYVKHGNPNYGGLRGFITKSWKQRFTRERRMKGRRVGKTDPEMEEINAEPEKARRTGDASVLERLGRKRSRQRSTREEEEEEENDDVGREGLKTREGKSSEAQRSKIPRMRMYADDEGDHSDDDDGWNCNSRSGVWKRLGLQDNRRVTRRRDGNHHHRSGINSTRRLL